MEGRKKAPEAKQFLRCSVLIEGRLSLRMHVFVPNFQRALSILTARGRDQVQIDLLPRSGTREDFHLRCPEEDGEGHEDTLQRGADHPDPKRRHTGSAAALPQHAERPHPIWTDDLLCDRTESGQLLQLLIASDEYTRAGLAIRVEKRLGAEEVIETLEPLFAQRGAAEDLRSDHGPACIAQPLRAWLGGTGNADGVHHAGAPPGRTGMRSASSASCGMHASTKRSSGASRKRAW